MEYRFLGIAWPSPVTVDLLLCNMKLQYEAMSTEASVCFEELPGPSIEKKKKTLCFLPSTHIFNSTLCTDMGFYICNVCCVNGKVLVDESGFQSIRYIWIN